MGLGPPDGSSVPSSNDSISAYDKNHVIYPNTVRRHRTDAIVAISFTTPHAS